jgi:hypothetical protein
MSELTKSLWIGVVLFICVVFGVYSVVHFSPTPISKPPTVKLVQAGAPSVPTKAELAIDKIDENRGGHDDGLATKPVKPVFQGRAFLPPGTGLTPVGVAVTMSDGSTQTFTLGAWIEFASGSGCSPACPSGGQLRGIFPTQYVGQPCAMQTNGTWTYTRAGRNVQVWRNGLLQQVNVDYTLNQAGMTITPLPITLGDGTVISTWNATDIVIVAFLY